MDNYKSGSGQSKNSTVNGIMSITFSRVITNVIEDEYIPADLIANLDQTPLSYVSPSK